MNTKSLIATALIALAGTTAWADDIGLDTTRFESTRSRSDVRAEVHLARSEGRLLLAGERSIEAAPPISLQPREAVRSQVRAANARHELMPAGEVVTLAMGTGPVARAQ